jgi:SAM-dependent methyltransferase
VSARASRSWWDADADGYLVDHGDGLGPVRLQWGPEGLDEAAAGFLGPVAGRRVLEVGCGAGQGARWAASQGAAAIGLDISERMLRHAVALDVRFGLRCRWLQADAQSIPLADSSVDLAFSAYGALPFLPEPAAVFREVARVLRPGGRWVCSVTHPVRWCFRDDPGPDGLVVERSYFDTRAYVEQDTGGQVTYVEHHHTVSGLVSALLSSGLELTLLAEPSWQPEAPDWGPWSRMRGQLLPGTLVLGGRRPG